MATTGLSKHTTLSSGLILLWLVSFSAAFVLHSSTSTSSSSQIPRRKTISRTVLAEAAPNGNTEESPQHLAVRLNEYFKKPVPRPIKQSISLYYENPPPEKDLDAVSILTAAPCVPGCPRPLWAVMLGSLPTGLVWYGYYKFCVEEELLQMELKSGKTPRGFGGYGTLGPFTYGLLLGPVASILHIPGGVNYSALGVIFIYYTQFLLYDRVNELYREAGKEEPLSVWWCLPIFFPFNLIVGLRQVHFLSQYFYLQRGANPPPNDPVADFFPFIKADKFTWQYFFLTPSLWCSLLADTKTIDIETLPDPLRQLLSSSTNDEKRSSTSTVASSMLDDPQ